MKNPNPKSKPELPLHEKWAQPRVVRDEFNPYKDPGISFVGDPGMTDQSQAEECDVNRIVDRFMKTGVLPGVDVEKTYGDFTSAVGFHEAMNIVLQAEEQFMGLKASVRKRFDNDPETFLRFVNDPQNAQELIQLGLATARPQPPSVASPEASQEVSKSVAK